MPWHVKLLQVIETYRTEVNIISSIHKQFLACYPSACEMPSLPFRSITSFTHSVWREKRRFSESMRKAGFLGRMIRFDRTICYEVFMCQHGQYPWSWSPQPLPLLRFSACRGRPLYTMTEIRKWTLYQENVQKQFFDDLSSSSHYETVAVFRFQFSSNAATRCMTGYKGVSVLAIKLEQK